MTKAAIGLIGLGVMGQNLSLNIERNGYSIAVYEREQPVLDAFVARQAGSRFSALTRQKSLFNRWNSTQDNPSGQSRSACGLDD